MAYVQQLQQLGIYGSKDPGQNDNEIAFYRGITEFAILAFFESDEDGPNGDQPREPYKAVDALAKLIVLLVKYYPDKVSLLGKIFGQVAQVMNGDFQTNPPEFNQVRSL